MNDICDTTAGTEVTISRAVIKVGYSDIVVLIRNNKKITINFNGDVMNVKTESMDYVKL